MRWILQVFAFSLFDVDGIKAARSKNCNCIAKRTMRAVILLWVLSSAFAYCSASAILPSVPSHLIHTAQNPIAPGQTSSARVNNATLNQERANAVKDAFTFAFNGYWEACKGQDELLPVSNSCSNSR